MTNVIDLSQYRSETMKMAKEAAAEAAVTVAELVAMTYFELLTWAGADFDRLVAVAKAKDYRPEWIVHQLVEQGRQPTGPEWVILDRLIADAGEYLTRRQRWILRQIRIRPMSELALAKLAAKAAEYRGYKHPDRCLAHDIKKLVERDQIQTRGGTVYYAVDAGDSGERSPGEATPHSTGATA